MKIVEGRVEGPRDSSSEEPDEPQDDDKWKWVAASESIARGNTSSV